MNENNTGDKALHTAYTDLSHVRALITSVARRLTQNFSPEVVSELEALLVAEEAAKCRFTILARTQEAHNA